jgi:DNA adenine methylase
MKDATEFFVKYGDVNKPRLKGAFKRFVEDVDIVDGTGRAGVREPMREKFELYIRDKVENWDEFKDENLTDSQLEDMMWGFLSENEQFRENFLEKYVTGDHDYELKDPNEIGRLKGYLDESPDSIGVTYDHERVKELFFLCANLTKTIPSDEETPDADEFVRYWADEWINGQFGVGASSFCYEGSFSDVDEKCVPIAREFYVENGEFKELLKDKWEYDESLKEKDTSTKGDDWTRWEYDHEKQREQQQETSEDKKTDEDSQRDAGDSNGKSRDGTTTLDGFSDEDDNSDSESDDGGVEDDGGGDPDHSTIGGWAESEGTTETSIDRDRSNGKTKTWSVSGNAKPEDAYEVNKDDIIGEQFSRNMDSIFPYIGGKTQLADWIIDNMPEHDCYVEVFGGSAAILLNKPRSNVEVYNDLNDDLVHFFKILRDKPQELRDWCKQMVYSRSWYEEIAEDFFNDVRVDDDVVRAGRFFYLINSTFGGKLSSKGWRKSETNGSESKAWESNLDKVEYFHERFKGVDVECKSYEKIFDLYDDEGVLFYLDPPYKDTESVYDDSAGFNHDKLAHKLMNLEGDFMLSYDHMPEWADDYYVERRAYKHAVNSVEKDVYEYLVMSTEESGFLQPQESLANY